MSKPLAPILLPTNRPTNRFYRGGAGITAFRSLDENEEFTPEDWVASTTSVRGQWPAGLTRLPDGELLADAVASNPVGWLGPEHVKRWGADTMLLVKLLDAGQRLPVHAHPDDRFAATELAASHGKAEAWFILEPGIVYLGLRSDIEPTELARLVEKQDSRTLLGLLNEVTVAAGDAVIVPPGTLHAIGHGILLVEVQQPADLSILLEWDGFAIDGARQGHLDIGFARALEGVSTRRLTPWSLSNLVRRSVEDGPVLSPYADEWFRLDRITGSETLPAGFGVAIATGGTSSLRSRDGELVLHTGSTAVIPAEAGQMEFSTGGVLVVARPPQP